MTISDITVILTLYKRPQYLKRQLEAILNQTLKAKEVWLFQDRIDTETEIAIPEEIKGKFDLIHSCTENAGVFGRFIYAQKAKTEYICIFDDDTIPGSRWLENCSKHMEIEQGLYGTNGVIFAEPEKYPFKGNYQVGWHNPNNSTIEVDIVGHSWFFKKEWLKYLLIETEEVQKLKITGEDMCFSANLQKIANIKTFVPPHPLNNKELWGSLPQYGFKFGNDKMALCMNNNNEITRNKVLKDLLDKGFTPLVIREKEKTKKFIKRMKLIKQITWLIRPIKLQLYFRRILARYCYE